MENDQKGGFDRGKAADKATFSEIDPRFFADLGTGRREEAAESEPPPRSVRSKRRPFRAALDFVFGGPISAFSADNIAQSASTIGSLASQIRRGPGAGPRVRIHDDRTLDLRETAFNARVSVGEIETMLFNKGRQTARAVFYYAFGAACFFGFWLWKAASGPAYTRFTYVIVLLLICGLFLLSAFYNALLNWQIRTHRLGTWREFLSTEESWWPSWKLAFPTIYWLTVQIRRLTVQMMRMVRALLRNSRG